MYTLSLSTILLFEVPANAPRSLIDPNISAVVNKLPDDALLSEL